MSKPGYVWDHATRAWKAIDYRGMSDEDLKKRRDHAADRAAEALAQLEAFLPAATAQSLLNRGADDLVDLLIKIAKNAPEALTGTF